LTATVFIWVAIRVVNGGVMGNFVLFVLYEERAQPVMSVQMPYCSTSSDASKAITASDNGTPEKHRLSSQTSARKVDELLSELAAQMEHWITAENAPHENEGTRAMETLFVLIVLLFAALATGGLMVNWIGLGRAMLRTSVSAYVEFHQHTNHTFNPYMPIL
jgi:hypothetical protein